MPNFTDLTGLASVASASAAALLVLPGMTQLAKYRLAVISGIVFVLMLIPFGEMPLAAYVRGVTGDLSIATLMLLWGALLRPWCGCGVTDVRSRNALLTLIALAALALYPMALGVGAFDPYRLGYGDPRFVSALLLIALAAWFWGHHLIGLLIALSILAWAIGGYESGNLWDYLLDPLVSIYALAATISRMVKTLLPSGRAKKSQPLSSE